MKLHKHQLGPDRPIRFPRKLKKRVIKEFGREAYYDCLDGFKVIRKYRPPSELSNNGWKNGKSIPEKIGTIELWAVLWDPEPGESKKYEESLSAKRRQRQRRLRKSSHSKSI